MKIRTTSLLVCGVALGLGALFSCSEAYGFEKSNPYTLTCTAQGGTSPAFTLHASGYSFQFAPQTIGSGSSGAGAGKVTFEPATITVSANEVTSAVAASLLTGNFSSCSLVPTDSASTLPSVTLNLITVNGYSFVAPSGNEEDGTATSGRVAITLQYGGIIIPATSSN